MDKNVREKEFGARRDYDMEKKICTGSDIWKRGLMQIGAAVFFLTAFVSHVEWEEYQVVREISFGGDDRITVLDVFAPGPEEPRSIAEEIKREYSDVNDDRLSDQLVIRFYRSDWHMKERRAFAEIVFDPDSLE